MLDAAVICFIRMVLQILGKNPDDQMVIMSQGQRPVKRRRRRSLIRAIGSSLPLAPIQRVHFQILRRSEPPPWIHQQRPFFEEDCEPTFIPSLSDLPWIITATPDKDIRSRSEHRPTKNKKKRRITMTVRPLHHTPPKYSTSPSPQHTPCRHSPLAFAPETPPPSQGFTTPPFTKVVDLEAKVDDPVAQKKITALEDELEKLRAQIALIVTLQSQVPQTDPSHTPCTPVSRMSIAPVMATPPPPPPPPPPFGAPPPCGAPPPPPPPPPPVSAPKLSAIDLIKQNRNKNKSKPKGQTSDSMPNMTDILKGLGTVKLKSIARSPGGTPIRKAPKASDATDPASIIARALKKKFAHARLSCSPTAANKENINSSGSPLGKSSPARHASPKFGQHLLKPTIRAQPNVRQPRPLTDLNA